MYTLDDFGWNEVWQKSWHEHASPGTIPARVVADFGTSLKVATPEVITAELSGKLAHYTGRDAVPKVGDWVSVRLSDHGNTTIEHVLTRTNEVSRKVAGKRTERQIIAANVDIAFILIALDNDFSVERLKRFLYQLAISKVEPVIVLNKADKTNDTQHYIDQLGSLELPIITAIATQNVGVDKVTEYIQPGKTAILLGSSGVGKSTLTNALLQRDAQAVGEVRTSDDTGMHTTVHRELFILPNKGLLIDMPGIRELQLWGTEDNLAATYAPVTELETQCRYKNCRHTTEAGCAITQALDNGTLDTQLYQNYLAMKQELATLAARSAEKARQAKLAQTRKKKARARDYYDD